MVEFISLEEARKLDKNKLHLYLGKHANYLRNECGLSLEDSRTFVSNLLNLGVAANEMLKTEKK